MYKQIKFYVRLFLRTLLSSLCDFIQYTKSCRPLQYSTTFILFNHFDLFSTKTLLYNENNADLFELNF